MPYAKFSEYVNKHSTRVVQSTCKQMTTSCLVSSLLSNIPTTTNYGISSISLYFGSPPDYGYNVSLVLPTAFQEFTGYWSTPIRITYGSKTYYWFLSLNMTLNPRRNFLNIDPSLAFTLINGVLTTVDETNKPTFVTKKTYSDGADYYILNEGTYTLTPNLPFIQPFTPSYIARVVNVDTHIQKIQLTQI